MSEDDFTGNTNITTKLKLKLFTKVIEEFSKEAWDMYIQSLIKR